MLKRFLVIVTLLLFAAVAFVGCGGSTEKAASNAPASNAPASEPAKEPFKVGFIYVGPVGDAGYTYAHDLGRKFLEEQVPGVKTIYMESVKEGTDDERALENLVQQGCKVIFATSFGYMDAVQKVAARHPDVIFEHCSGYKTSPNAGTYFGRDYQARYLAGIVAGKATKSNTIGYVAAQTIPEVYRGIDAFTLGALSVNPKVKVKVNWTNTWYDPVKEKEAAKSLLEQGADVIAQHQDTPAAMQAAEEAGKLALGYNSDMRKFAPKAVMTGPVWNWGPYYVNTVKAVMDKTWKMEQYWGSMKEGIIDLGPYGPMVTEEVKALVAAKKQEINDGKFIVFNGPIKDNTGKVRVPAGSTMSDKDMLSMDWLVQGVEATKK